MNFTRTIQTVVACAILLCGYSNAEEASSGEAAASPFEELRWVHGPSQADLTRLAQIEVPKGFSYLGSEDTRKLMELFENPTGGEEYYVGPDDMRWFAIFSFEETGYITDDEQIDAEALLQVIKDGTDAGNVQRRERGWAEMTIQGWAYEPFYEAETNRLAWAIVAQTEGEQVVNYNTRLLGRSGVMSATLVGDLATLEQDVAEFKGLLTRFQYNTGNAYADFRDGDRLAGYGLAALVAGGAAAAVASSSAAKGFLKFLWVGLIAGFAAIWSFVKRALGKKELGKKELGKKELGKKELGKKELGKEELGQEELGTPSA